MVRRASVKGDYQITSAYQERTIDPDNFYSLVVRSGGDINTTRVLEPGGRPADRPGADRDRRAEPVELYKQIRQIVFEDAPMIFVHYETINYLMHNDVVGLDREPDARAPDAGRGFTEGSSS